MSKNILPGGSNSLRSIGRVAGTTSVLIGERFAALYRNFAAAGMHSGILTGFCSCDLLLARFLHGHVLRQDALLNKADHSILGILVKFLWYCPDFPIYSNGTKPGVLQQFRVYTNLCFCRLIETA